MSTEQTITMTTHAKRHNSPTSLTRFDKLEASLSVLTFGFDAIRKRCDDTAVKANKTIDNVNTFKEQITELINGYVKRIDEAERKELETQNALRERERELFDVKRRLGKQEQEIELLKLMIERVMDATPEFMVEHVELMNGSMNRTV